VQQIVNKKPLKSARAKLRSNMPAPENILWQRLRRRALGYKFRRQYSFGNKILDFYSHEVRLAIEIDGDSHYLTLKAQTKDAARDLELQRMNIRVLRFTNRDIMDNIEGVITKILESTPS